MAKKTITASWIIPDGETPHDSQELTIAARFAAERKKFERLNGLSLIDAYAGTGLLGKRQLDAIESGARSIDDALWPTLITKQFDVQYILTGERILTEAEYAVRDIMRLCDPEDRATLLTVAQKLTLNITEVHDAFGETIFLRGPDGNVLHARAIEMVDGPLESMD